MNSYRSGMGYSTAGGAMNQYASGRPVQMPAAVNGSVALSGGINGGGGSQGPALTLILILGGLVVFYVATRRIQGSV